MRKDLFKNYSPRWFHQLQVGDTVWAVQYGKWPGIVKYKITEVKSNDDFKWFWIERDMNDTECTFIGMYSTSIDFDLHKPICSLRTSSFYHKRVFSDEIVAKHSLSEHIKRLQRKLNGQKAKIQRFIDHAKKLEDYMSDKLLKTEKTCVCIAELEIDSDNNAKEPQARLQFHVKREYQVDIFYTATYSVYKIYQNGGWDDYVRLKEDEFNKYFKLIK